jgi:hypothetical protein
MPFDVPIYQFSNYMLKPVRNQKLARPGAVNLAPGSYAAGTLLGQISAAANDVQTLTVTATGGTYALTVEEPIGNQQKTAPIAFNASAATIQAALAALSNVGSGNVTVTGTGPFTITFVGALAAQPIQAIAVDNTLATGGTGSIAHTTTGVTGGEFKAYASGNSDGSQVPECFLAIDCQVDNEGFITPSSNSSQSSGGLWGEKYRTAPVWYGGEFNLADLTGLDANAVTKLAGRFAVGSLSSGQGVFVF